MTTTATTTAQLADGTKAVPGVQREESCGHRRNMTPPAVLGALATYSWTVGKHPSYLCFGRYPLKRMPTGLTLLELQSRLGDNPLESQALHRLNETAVLKG